VAANRENVADDGAPTRRKLIRPLRNRRDFRGQRRNYSVFTLTFPLCAHLLAKSAYK
jgi:hypothetical protein